jgi:hypothetical protein
MIPVPSLLLIALDDSHDLARPTFAAHPDLFAQNPSILSRHYRHETLRSRRARRVVIPDLV